MFAIVEIAGLQYKVEQDQKLFVNRLSGEAGDKISFDKVLLTVNGTTTVGAPAVSGVSVQAEILDHLKADKVIVFKKKRRKGYKVKNGHRQFFTEIQISEILASGGKKAPAKESKPKKSKDDLTKVEGIGPKAAEALSKAGVNTFEKLSKKSVEEIRTILVEASKTLAHLDPQTWAQQAKLAAEGKWDELKKWQDELNGGIVK